MGPISKKEETDPSHADCSIIARAHRPFLYKQQRAQEKKKKEEEECFVNCEIFFFLLLFSSFCKREDKKKQKSAGRVDYDPIWRSRKNKTMPHSFSVESILKKRDEIRIVMVILVGSFQQ